MEVWHRAFPDEVDIEGEHTKCFAVLCAELGRLVSVDDLECEIASGVAFTSFEGDLANGLDWWAGIGYYHSFGWCQFGPGYTGEEVGW